MGFQDTPGLAAEAGRKGKRGPAKYSEETREMVAKLIEKLYSNVIDDLDNLDTKEKALILAKLFEYQIPKIRYNQVDIETNEQPVIIFQNASKDYKFDKDGKSTKKIPCEPEV